MFPGNELMYKGRNLLAFDGQPCEHGRLGRFLARNILTREERENRCWFPYRALKEGKKRVDSEDEMYFRGSHMVF